MEFHYEFKLLVIGDSGVGKGSLLSRFLSENFANLSPTVGMDIKFKLVNVQGKKLKLSERFNSLTHFAILRISGSNEIQQKLNDQVCIKMIVGNKADFKHVRDVTVKEGRDFARRFGWLFEECSAKTGENVVDCFMELASKIMEEPCLLAQTSIVSRNINLNQESAEQAAASSCRSWCLSMTL